MAFAPFRDFLALIILDGDFDLPQHLLALDWLMAVPRAATVCGVLKSKDVQKNPHARSNLSAASHSGTATHRWY